MCKTVFIDAIKKGDSDQIDSLLATDPSLAAERDDNGVSLVLLALYHGKPQLAAAIASQKESLDLFEACALGRNSRVIELLDEDADAVHSFTPDGFPLLGYAAFFGRTELARLLIDRGADVNVEANNPMKVHPLHSGVAFHDPEVALETARLLLDAGAEPNAEQQMGYTALQSAALHGNRPLVDLLIDRGADKSRKSEDGKSSGDMARQGGYEELAEFLDRH